MEKRKPKNQIYTSQKVLGQLYDHIERINFFPNFSAPFDRRILNAYNVPAPLLATARQIKEEYDAAVRRIMAKHDIKTEFEVWSNFVLAHNKSNGGDFKFHEEIGQISGAFKCQFRELCIETAGGRDYDQLGPFVAAMYQVTAEEIAKAVEECNQSKRQMKSASMPLMSFPWIFQDVLGKIAKLHTTPFGTSSTCAESLPQSVIQTQNIQSASRKGRGLIDAPDLETAQGVIHQGDIFQPFASQYMKDLEGLGGGDVNHSQSTRSPTLSILGQPESLSESETPLDSELEQLTLNDKIDGLTHLSNQSSIQDLGIVNEIVFNSDTGDPRDEQDNEAAQHGALEEDVIIDCGSKRSTRRLLEAFTQYPSEEEEEEEEEEKKCRQIEQNDRSFLK